MHDTVGIVPKYNLISNLGFGTEATHTFDPDSHEANLSGFELEYPLVHPVSTEPDKHFDLLLLNVLGYKKEKLSKRIKMRW
jgi:hypothetical protein